MERPAPSPGWLLEAIGDDRSRGMTALARIRLRGLLGIDQATRASAVRKQSRLQQTREPRAWHAPQHSVESHRPSATNSVQAVVGRTSAGVAVLSRIAARQCNKAANR